MEISYEKIEKWFVLFVFAGYEDKIKSYILDNFKDIKVFIPKREIYERKQGELNKKIKTLFPGYIFITGDITREKIDRICDTTNIIKFLTDCNGELAPVKKEEMFLIFELTQKGNLIKTSKAFFDENDLIRVVAGPLKNDKFKIVSVDRRRKRIKIKLSLLGEIRKISLSYDLIEKISKN